MQIQKFEDRPEWLAARVGKITGSRLGKIVVKRGTGKKIGFYELIAERLGLPADGEDPMERGTRLEAECMERFTKETGKKLDTSLVLWSRDDDQSIAISPDASVVDEPAAVEGKALGSARHIEAWQTQQVPDEYEFQKLQYFIVNEELQELYFCFYDPRIPAIDFFYLHVKRADVQEEVDKYLEYQRKELAEVNEIVNKLTF